MVLGCMLLCNVQQEFVGNKQNFLNRIKVLLTHTLNTAWVESLIQSIRYIWTNNAQYRLKIILVTGIDPFHKYSSIGNAWNCSQMGRFYSAPSPTFFLVINSYCRCWPRATHLTEGGTTVCSRCGTLGSAPSAFICTMHWNFPSRHTVSISATRVWHRLVRNKQLEFLSILWVVLPFLLQWYKTHKRWWTFHVSV